MQPEVSMSFAIAVLSLSLATSASAQSRAPQARAPQARSDAPMSKQVAPPARSAVPSMLPEAARTGDIAAVRAELARGGAVNAAQGDGMTALHWAAERGDVAMATLLLRAGAKSNVTSRIGSYTPLHIASRNGHGAVVAALLKSGSDASVVTTSGATALHLAAASGDSGAVMALLVAGADANAREREWGQTPLMFAAAANRSAAIRVLLAHKADAKLLTRAVDLTEQASREQLAAKKRNEVIISYLPPKMRDSIRAVATAAAAADSAAKVVAAAAAAKVASAGAPSAATAAAALVPAAAPAVAPAPAPAVAAPAATPVPRPSSETPPTGTLTPEQIQEAIEAGRVALLAPITGPVTLSADTSDGQVAGFEGTVGYMGGMTALHHAVRQGNADAVMALLAGGADINQRTAGDSTTPLLMAAINGQFDVAMRLVEKGADVKLSSIHGATPLYAAINAQWLPRSRFPQPQAVQNQRTTHLELMEAIIKAGADVNVRLKKNLWYFGYNNCGNANCGLEYLDGSTPFWRAAYAVDLDAMRLLKQHGADATIPAVRVAPARAARGGAGGGGGGGFGPAAPVLDAATDSAAKAVPPGIGVFPIHAAAGVGYGNGFAGNSHRHAPDGWMPALKYLVEELGADVNARDNNGFTPLHHAAARGDNAMIEYLVSKGADVRAVSRRGQTTVDMANGPVQRLRPFPETITLLEKMGAKNSHRCAGC